MTFDYARSKATAERLIARFGGEATLRKRTSSGPDYAPTLTLTEHTITAVDLNQRLRDAGGALVGQSLRTLYVSTAAGVTPEKGDKVVIDGSEHEIAEVRTLAPGGTTVMWECDLAI